MTGSTLELFVPFLLILALGYAVLQLIAPTAGATAVERLALTFVLGSGGVSLLSWWLSALFVYVAPTWAVTCAISTIVAVALLVKSRLSSPSVELPRCECWTVQARALVLTLITLCALVVIVSLVTPLGWDGLINFEFKARIGFLSEPSGVIPSSYFTDASRAWSHQRYPLLLPLVEGWLYQWMGEPNQAAIKILFPLFYLSLVAFVYAAVRRSLSRTWSLAACLGFTLIPAFAVGPGGATSGYADLPLTAIVFAAVQSTRISLATGSRDHMRLAAVLSALASWAKIEGLLLAVCLVGGVILGRLVTSKTENTSPVSTPLVVLLIGVPLLVIGPWWVFGQVSATVPNGDFMSATTAHVANNLGRLPIVAGLMAREFLRAGRWASLWPAFAVMAAICFRHLRRPSDSLVTVMVVAPQLLYMFMYVLSAWPSLTDHVATSLPRLLLPLAALAWMGTVGHLQEALNWCPKGITLEGDAKSEGLVLQGAVP
jgi:hypothetical protein